MPQENKPIHLLAISGSLKAGSVNTSLLREVKDFGYDHLHYKLFEGLEELPPFNPDKEAGNSAVSEFKQLLREADGILISTPEYAFGMPGVLKNALDWTVHTGDLNNKPVAVISASPLSTGGNKAMASLLLTLGALGTVTEQSLVMSIPDILKKINTERRLTDEATLKDLKRLVDHLIETIHRYKTDAAS